MQNDDLSKGLLFALAGFALLATGDAVIKTMAGQWSPLAVAALRFAIGAAGLSVLLWRHEGSGAFRPRRPLLQVVRGTCLAMATLFFFSSIFLIPLAAATALVFISPILTALLAGPVLGEKVRRATWIASAMAFAGVVIVLRPNVAEIGWAACLPLCSAAFFSGMVITNRAVAGEGSALSMQVFVALVAAPILALAALAGWASGIPLLEIGPLDWDVAARCAIVAVTASSAHWLIYRGTERAGASSVAPMTYVQLLIASALGWWWFGDVPDLGTLGGAAIIIGAGLYLWRSGRRVPKVRVAT
ncbi:DMT family transporter [Qipengyuania sp. JC766]|uniref:DMT family transporter n=1 Tax=Qipengyuania sp. JC766 TaxID=3232139 RepID=UPI003459078F